MKWLAMVVPPTVFAFQDGLEAHAAMANCQVSSLAETEEARQTVIKVHPRPAMLAVCFYCQETQEAEWFVLFT